MHPTAFVFMIDRSSSMSARMRFHNKTVTKAEAVAAVTNTLLSELVERARRADGVRDYYDIAVLGYAGGEVSPIVGDGFVPISRLAAMPSRIDRIASEHEAPDGRRMVMEESLPVWVEPQACGDTPMFEAMMSVRDMVAEWCRKERNRDSFPPVVFNITDGEASDCDADALRDMASQIKSCRTADGNTLLINIHISEHAASRPTIFPSADEIDRDDRYAALLYDISSVMPVVFDDIIAEYKHPGNRPPYTGMAYNASIAELVVMLNIGSRSVVNLQ